MRRSLAAATALLATLFLASGCGDEEKPDAGGSASPKVIEVTFEGDTVTPNGDRITVDRGQDIKLQVTADTEGEIHVHSNPEQELEYKAGETSLTITGIDEPGTVEVESHELDKVIVQLEVR